MHCYRYRNANTIYPDFYNFACGNEFIIYIFDLTHNKIRKVYELYNIFFN